MVERSDSMLRVLARFRAAQLGLTRSDIDDILQEVWLEASGQLDRFEYRGRGSLQRWLAAILRFKLLEAAAHQRRGKGRTMLDLRWYDAQGGFLHHQDSRHRTSRPARRQEAEDAVYRALQRLDDRDRDAILLHIYEGHSQKQAASLSGISADAFRKRFYRALDRLRKFLPEGLV